MQVEKKGTSATINQVNSTLEEVNRTQDQISTVDNNYNSHMKAKGLALPQENGGDNSPQTIKAASK